MRNASDMELLREYARQDSEAAFAELVRRHIGLVYSAALRHVGIAAQAEEITQAVFIILARKAASLRESLVLDAWLFETTRLTALSFLRGERRRQFREQEAYMQSILQESTPDPVWPQLAPLLDEAMMQLGRRDREAVVLRFFKGQSLGEVAAALNIKEPAAQKRVDRALDKLHCYFSRRGISSTTAIIAGTISANSVHLAPAALAQAVTAAAVAKGVTTSISTLTLIKGALKIMAWTKTKTAIVSGAAALLLIGTGTVAVKTINAARTAAALARLQGSWEGTLNTGTSQLRLVLNIFKTNGLYRATIDSIDQGAKDIPVASLSARSDSFHAELPALDGDYRAVLKSGGTEMSGTWRQLNRSYPLTLKRTATPERVVQTMPADEYAPRAGSDLQGAWEGTLKVGDTALRLNLRIAEPAPGTFQARVDSVDQGARDLPVTSFTYEKPAVRFTMAAIHGEFSGTLNDQDNQIAGTWTQLGNKLPLTFQRVAANASAASAAALDYGHGAGHEVQGHWQGTLAINQLKLRIVFNIALLQDGSYSATLDSPDQGATGIPATSAQVTYPDVRLEWKGIGGVFTGKLANGKLFGTWRQGNTALPLQLEPAAAQ